MLAVIFALFAFLASFGIGNMVQANSTTEEEYIWLSECLISILPLLLSIIVGLVIWGGLNSIATVYRLSCPFMAIFYILGAFAVLIQHIDAIPAAFAMAVEGAFGDPKALPGALAGWAVKSAITRGIARGVFSNEAGLGSAPMVHCTAKVDHPVRQGFYGLLKFSWIQ